MKSKKQESHISELIEDFCMSLNKVDISKSECKLTKTEYEKVADKKLLESLIEGYEDGLEWEEFKTKFQSVQKEFGFIWARTQGQYGTLSLTRIDLPSMVGEELAKDLFNKRVDKGDINNKLRDFLPNFFEYLESHSFDKNNLDLSETKRGFKDFGHNNQKYKFITNSQDFKLSIENYSYKSTKLEDNQKIETELGWKIKAKIKNLLKLDKIYHQQERREYGKFQNVDFEGYRIISQLKGDEIEVVNIELKPTNRIEDISRAISQAVNYKESSNKTYIAIPLFDSKSFYEPKRHKTFLRLCEENQIGIISIDIDTNTHEIIDLEIVLEAPSRQLIQFERGLKLLDDKNDKKEFCPMCHRIVPSKIEDRINSCQWTIHYIEKNEPKSFCMKLLLEKSMIEGVVNEK